MSDKRDDDVNTEFDQTNGLAEGLTGDSNGTVQGEEHSEVERDDEDTTLVEGTPSEDLDQ